MNNIENIIKIIIDEANENAKQIREDAKKEYEEKLEITSKELNADFDRKKSMIDQNYTDAILRAEKSANLEKSKILLKIKHDFIDEIFDTVLENLCNLEQYKYESLINNLLVCYAKEEDAVSLSADSKVDEAFLTSLDVFRERKLKYVYSKSAIKGGFVLSNSTSDTIVSFENIVEELKEKYSYEISKELFE